jgi:hypothetical protein
MILNLTQHPATPDQLDAGVRDVGPEFQGMVNAALNFTSLPTRGDISTSAVALAKIALALFAREKSAGHAMADKMAMIGGAPYLMAPLEEALRALGVGVCYAFSQRESVEEIQADGGVRKVAVFRHAGFVMASPR